LTANTAGVSGWQTRTKLCRREGRGDERRRGAHVENKTSESSTEVARLGPEAQLGAGAGQFANDRIVADKHG